MFDESRCEGCPIQGMYEPLEPQGPENARFLVVTDVPSMESAKRGRLISTGAMGAFAGRMIDSGFAKEDFRFAPACFCPYDPNSHVTKIKTAVHKHCRQHLVDEVDTHRPDVLIPLGALAASQALGRATKITKVRGIVANSEEFRKPVFPLMSPGQVVAYPQNGPVFDADVASFTRFVEAGYDESVAGAAMCGDYQVITDLQFLIDRDPELIAFDMEATGLRWYKQGMDVRSYRAALHKGRTIFDPKFQILTMQFTLRSGEAYMLVWDHPDDPVSEALKPKLRNQLRSLLCNEKRIVIGQNIKFDNVALWMTENIRFRIGGDTLLLAALTDENMPEKNLDILVKIYVPEMAGYADVFNATYDKARMWEVPLKEMLAYGCGDTDAVFRLYDILEEKVASDDKLWANYCHVTIPGLNALASMETQGMYIDEADALAGFKKLMVRQVREAEAALMQEIPRAVKRDVVTAYCAKNKKPDAAVEALKLSRTEFLKQILFTHEQGFYLEPKVFTKTTKDLHDETKREPSVSAKDHLPWFFDTCPFTERLADYLKDNSLLTKSVISFEKKYIWQGKVRPTYHLHKAVTGRTSSEDPNGQNYPKRGERALAYRRMFVAPPGCFVCELDLSQAELRIAACMSGDRTMIQIYNTPGGDIHTATALIVLGTTMEKFRELPKSEQKDARTKAKSVNFGFLYGMGWRKFIGFAKTQYGVEFTEQEAKRVRTGFFKQYRSLSAWHDRTKEFASKHKMVRSYSGRVRHLPMIDSNEEYIQQEALRQAINSPVQEFGSSLGVMALGRLNEEISRDYLQVVGFIHDAIVVYVKKEYLDWGMRTVKSYMQSNPLEEWFGTRLQVPIVADCGFGLNLGEIHECDGFALDKPFNYRSLTDKQGNLLIDVPPQKIPPNKGRLTRSPYTIPEDLEDETCVRAVRRTRLVRAAVTQATVKRMRRSAAQMIINRRNEEKRKVQKRTRSAVS